MVRLPAKQHGAPRRDASSRVSRCQFPIVSSVRFEAASPASRPHGVCVKSITVHCVSNCWPTSDSRHGIGNSTNAAPPTIGGDCVTENGVQTHPPHGNVPAGALKNSGQATGDATLIKTSPDGKGFFASALTVIAVGIACCLLLSLADVYDGEYLRGEYLPYFVLLGFSEAWLSGMFTTLFAVYRPDLLADAEGTPFAGRK